MLVFIDDNWLDDSRNEKKGSEIEGMWQRKSGIEEAGLFSPMKLEKVVVSNQKGHLGNESGFHFHFG